MDNKVRSYCPSNGSEGEWFISQYCAKCIHEQFLHTQNGNHKTCKILSDTMVFSVNDPGYPKEWIYDNEGNPDCTAFKKWEWQFDEHGNPVEDELPTEDPNQLSIF